MGTAIRWLLLLAVTAIAIFLSVACSGDKGTIKGEDSPRTLVWVKALVNGTPEVLVLDGESLEPIDTLLFDQGNFEAGQRIPETNLVLLSWAGQTPSKSAFTCVVDPVSRDTLSMREQLGGSVAWFSPDGKFLVLGQENATALSLPALATIGVLSESVGLLAFDTRNDQVLSSNSASGNQLRSWKIVAGMLQYTTIPLPSIGNHFVFGVRQLMSLSVEGRVLITIEHSYWDLGNQLSSYEIDTDSFRIIRRWPTNLTPTMASRCLPRSKMFNVVAEYRGATNDFDFRFDLVNQDSLTIEKSIPESYIRGYALGNIQEYVSALEVSPDQNWIYLTIPALLDRGSTVYQIDVQSFSISRVEYLEGVICQGLISFDNQPR